MIFELSHSDLTEISYISCITSQIQLPWNFNSAYVTNFLYHSLISVFLWDLYVLLIFLNHNRGKWQFNCLLTSELIIIFWRIFPNYKRQNMNNIRIETILNFSFAPKSYCWVLSLFFHIYLGIANNLFSVTNKIFTE